MLKSFFFPRVTLLRFHEGLYSLRLTMRLNESYVGNDLNIILEHRRIIYNKIKYLLSNDTQRIFENRVGSYIFLSYKIEAEGQ